MSSSDRAQSRDHAGMEVLDSAECFRLLRSVPVGRVAYVADGKPQIFPVTFGMEGERIVYRSAIGSKLDSAEMTRDVAFEVDGWDPATREGWSVVAQGRSEVIDDPERTAGLEELDLRPWLDGDDMRWIEVRIDQLSGRRLPGQD